LWCARGDHPFRFREPAFARYSILWSGDRKRYAVSIREPRMDERTSRDTEVSCNLVHRHTSGEREHDKSRVEEFLDTAIRYGLIVENITGVH
jgi:hypothetical protein